MEDGPDEMVKLLGINKLENFRDSLSSDQWFKTLRVRPPVDFTPMHAPEPSGRGDTYNIFSDKGFNVLARKEEDEKFASGLTWGVKIGENIKIPRPASAAPVRQFKSLPTRLVTTMGDPRRMGLA